MVALDTVVATNPAIVQSQPIVAVFVGAAGVGIGTFTIRQLAATHGSTGKGLRVYLVGRNADKAAEVIAECRTLCPSGEFIFVKANDLSLLKDVKAAAAEVIRLETEAATKTGEQPRIDILCQSQGKVRTSGKREETPEGLEFSMSLLYYSRLLFITDFLPLLLSSRKPNGASVISVYASGFEATFYPNDLSLRQRGHYSFGNCRSHVVYMKTVAFERLAREYAGKLSLVHIYPGLVLTEAFFDKSLPLWLKAAFTIFWPLMKAVSTSQDESGKRILNAASTLYPGKGVNVKDAGVGESVKKGSDGDIGSGAYALDSRGEPNSKAAKYRKLDGGKEKLREDVWAHTMKAFAEIEKGGVFRD